MVNVLWLQDVLFGHHLTALNALNKSSRYTRFDIKDACDLDYNLVRQWLAPWRVPIKLPDNFGDEKSNSVEGESKPDITNVTPCEPMDVEKAETESTTSNSNNSNIQPTSQQTADTIMADDTKVNVEQNVKAELEKIEPGQPLAEEPSQKKLRLSPELSLEISTSAAPENYPTDSTPSLTPTGATPAPSVIPSLINPPLSVSYPENVSVKIMFSGFSETTQLTQLASSLGLTIATDYTQCTHLVMPKILRTVKFLCSLNHVNHIVHPDWLINCAKRGHLVDELPFYVNDPKGEGVFGFNLKESLQKRKARGTPLFQGFLFCITKSCIPSFKVLKDIVESAGALGATRKIPSPKQLKQLQVNYFEKLGNNSN